MVVRPTSQKPSQAWVCRQQGKFRGFPALGVTCQTLESPVLRSYLGMQASHKGVLVCSVAPTAPAAAQLQRDDVLLRFDGVQVANDGTVPFRQARADCLAGLGWGC